MRILFDSKNEQYKSPFGTVVPKELCAFHIWIPVSCLTTAVELVFRCDRTAEEHAEPLRWERREGDYDIWGGTCSFPSPDLYFYWFRITTEHEQFRLFRYGDRDTNIEDGDLWQLSCVSEDYPAPDWARGAVLYQVFPDRFHKAGDCDCTEKLGPYTLHQSTDEPVEYRPNEQGKVLNNDFYGGNLRGIREKLPYLRSLGVGILYMNPIFMAYSTHRYDTCDYKRIDPMLGTEEDFAALCEAAHELGIRVILDGVFSHTGSASVYFDRENNFGHGAYHDPDSPYRSWYQFRNWPDDYVCWWDFETLPCLNKLDESYINYIIDAEDSVIAKWLHLGADGFRLDVVDELPDSFVLRLRRRIRALKPDALLLGEVWEDASNKEAYGVRRRYFTDGELDGVMNYPWRKAILRFCRGEDDGTALAQAIGTITENYPRQVMDCTMNLLSSHDVTRALTELAAPFEGTREEMAAHNLTPEQRAEGIARLKLAAVLQYALPGMPAIYYGDEAGMEGCKDPFNRAFYPWGREDGDLRAHYAFLGRLRQEQTALRRGTVEVTEAGSGRITLRRHYDGRYVEITVDVPAGAYWINGECHEVGKSGA